MVLQNAASPGVRRPVVLADVVSGRDNNFKVIRFVAAFSVLVCHSFPLARGKGAEEPLMSALGMPASAIAVDVFFFTSGLLVTASLFKKGCLLDFAWARILRVYPALLAVVFASVFALGPALTDLGIREYARHPQTGYYLAKCATLVLGVTYELPGVFVNLPYAGVINGSLWTLPKEVYMYVMLGGAWVLPRVGALRGRVPEWAVLLLLYCGALGVALYSEIFPRGRVLFPWVPPRLAYFFMAGSVFWIWRHRIPLLRGKGILAAGLLLGLVLVVQRGLFNIGYLLALPHLVLWAAYVPAGAIRKFNALGDYSYGIYIWAFPVQQIVVGMLPWVTPAKLTGIAACVVLPLAVLSWHLLEERALRLRESVVEISFGCIRRWLPLRR